ncbi:hypothetical protein GW626_17525 [Peribacillus muralis]|uniref:hypothetical protein n=1 Tax=Peribacillus muralis TaxID=264697 RepID=UPI001F4E3676|nr:hypothetical protein [Peribacillus muralis]MCK2012711.1 hypothetical protein [Peribacillus muralis]
MVLFIGIPALMMWRSYKKMTEEERNDFRTDVASKRFAATYGLLDLATHYYGSNRFLQSHG